MFEFASPNWFWLLLIVPVYLTYELFYKSRKVVRIIHPSVKLLKEASGHSSLMRFLPLVLRTIIILLLVTSLARPRFKNKQTEIVGRGIDIMLAIDVSGSMHAIDFQPTNRLEAAKKVASEFIKRRPNDRIGIVTFAENAFTRCPLTLDYRILNLTMDSIEIDDNANGTAIGLGLGQSVARLEKSDAKSKVVILITDGRNNTGEIEPLDAAELAKIYDIKVYPIGVGSKGMVDFPYKDAWGRTRYQKGRSDVDMETLDKIAEITGTRKARRAHNTKELEQIVELIDSMEKSTVKVNTYYQHRELFGIVLILAMIFLIAEAAFRFLLRKEIP